MADALAETHLRRMEHLLTEANQFRQTWQEIADYMMPGKRNITVTRTPGERGTEKLHDSTAIDASNLLASSISGSVFSPALVWSHLEAQDERINSIQACAQWLADDTRRMHLGFSQSNLYGEIGETLLDLVDFATGCLYEEETEPESPHFSGFRFKAVPVGDYVIDEDANGIVNTLYRFNMQLPAQAIAAQWPDAVPRTVDDAIRSDKPHQKFEIVHAVYPREGGKSGGFARNMPFASLYIFRSDKAILEERGYEEFPYFCPRWSKASGELYGRGPGFFALPDVKTLNHAKETEERMWALNLDPPLKQRSNSVIGRVRLTPGGITLMSRLDDLQPVFDRRTDWRVEQIKSQELVGKIQRIFYWDQLQLANNDRMTATEISARVELMQRILGPTLGKMDVELAKLLVQRSFLLQYRKDAYPPPPPEMVQYISQGGAIQIRYEGTLARSQRKTDIEAVQRVYATLGPLVQVTPEILDNIDPDGAAQIVLEASGVSPKMMRDPKVRDRIRQARLQAQQQQQRLDTAAQLAQAAGRAAPLVGAVSTMQQATKGMGGNGAAP